MPNFTSYDNSEVLMNAIGQRLKNKLKQVSIMPIYTDFNLGDVVQYIGTTGQDYRKGYFYERTASGWAQLDTQPGTQSIPTALSDLSDDSTHRLVTDAEKTAWNAKSDFSGSYNDLDNKPESLPASDVKAWAKADTKPSYNASEVGAIDSSLKGANNGVAELDSSGKVPSSQLPSSLALGETSSTAYRGDRGKTAYNHATESGKVSTAVASGLYKVAVTAQGHIASTAEVVKADITALGIPGSDTDTKNTAGSTDTSSKIFLIGATSQAANPQTYSDNEVYAQDGVLTSKKLSTKVLTALTGTGTAGSDKGSGVSPRYIPSLWTFNAGITVANAEVYFIRIPVAGGTFGVWLSLNNGTNYYPVAVSSGSGRFTTHYAKNTVIAVTYESASKCSCYAKDGADAVADVTGIFRVLNDYDANSTYSAMSTAELTAGTVTTSRSVRSDYLKAGINSLIETYKKLTDNSISCVVDSTKNGYHAEGSSTTANEASAHSEGGSTLASGQYSHAEGYSTKATMTACHAEGSGTTASGFYSHAEGYNTSALDYAHAEGRNTKATVSYSHAEGYNTTASGQDSHAEGYNTSASGQDSHAEGSSTKAIGVDSHAEGYSTTASNFGSHSGGHLNAAMTTGGAYNNTTGTAFVIGNGTSNSAKSNAFSVQYNGVVKAASTITASTTADYAEYFEWADENPNDEDRVGYFVTFDDGNKVRKATDEDNYILGVVSGEPFVLGNGDCDVWNGMFLRDEFRRVIYEPAPEYEIDENGKEVPKLDENGNQIYTGTKPVLNPEYDHTKPYINRADRKEWDAIGMLGVLAVRDDGSCEVNGYATVNSYGIATKAYSDSVNKYRVIKRNSENVVEIVFR